MSEQAHITGNNDPAPIDFGQIKDQLYPRLIGYQSSRDAREAAELLNALAGHALMVAPCIKIVRSELAETAKDQAGVVNRRFCTQVTGTYPAGAETTPDLMSPKRFIRENGLDGRMRPELRDAQAVAINASKDKLIKAVKEDEAGDDVLMPEITDEELEAEIVHDVSARMETLRERTMEITSLMPTEEVPLTKLGSQALRFMHYDNPVTVTNVKRPASGKDRAKLDSAVYSLKQVLKDLLDGETVVAQALAQKYKGQVRDYVSCALISRYEELESLALASLPAEIEAAYAEAAHLGPSYQPQATQELPAEEEPAPELPTQALVSNESSRPNAVITVKNPFEWVKADEVTVEVVQKDGLILVHGNAMTSNMRAMSQKIRTDSQTDKKLDDMWARIVEVELQGEAHGHNLITTIRTDFHDLSVYYFSNHRHNGLRTYYARTKLSRFPELAAALGSDGSAEAPSESNLLILLAETDKANQAEVWQELNARRRFQ